MKWVLGTVSYLNAVPLNWALGKRSDVELVRMLPAQLGEHLGRGDLHASLSPVFDVLNGIGDTILGNAIVGATKQVRSVLLFHRKSIEDVRSIALDTSSHSSVNLVRVLMRDFYRIEPRFFDAKPDLETMLREADAAVMIGDPALENAQRQGDWQILDLAGAWHDFTGLSFTFAAWSGKPAMSDDQSHELAAILTEARVLGQQNTKAIVEENPTNSPLTPAIRESYLREAIQYEFTPTHQAGLREYARRLGLPFPRLLGV